MQTKSYHSLKFLYVAGQYPIQNLEERTAHIKRFADVIFVITGTDPTPFIQVGGR
jgi:hypothetical protein